MVDALALMLEAGTNPAGDRELAPHTLPGGVAGARGRGQTAPDIAVSVNE